jgi:hypothetical protein
MRKVVTKIHSWGDITRNDGRETLIVSWNLEKQQVDPLWVDTSEVYLWAT